MSGKGVRVLLQQNTMAHYRAALCRHLANQEDVCFDFVFDARTDTPFMQTVAHQELSCAYRAEVFRLPLGISWQPEAVRRALGRSYDVIIAQGSPYSLTAWCLLALRPFHRARVLLWTHGLLRAEGGLKGWMRIRFYRSSDGLILYGDRARRLLEPKLPAVPLFVVYNGLDSERLTSCYRESLQESVSEARARLGCPRAERVLLFVGRLQPIKRLDLLVEALAELRGRGRSVEALLVGEGSEESSLRQLAAERGVAEQVHFLGPSHEEQTLAGCFRAADVTVIPAGAGLTVIHSLSYRTPVVVHERFEEHFPEVEAIELGTTGFCFEPGSVPSLAAVLEQALYPVPAKERLGREDFSALFDRFSALGQARRIRQATLAAAEGRS